MKLSIVAPIYNEEGNVKELYRQIKASVDSLKALSKIQEYEIIFVNDGSSDESMNIMRTLSPLTVINFRKNFGQTAALDAGIKASTGDVIILLDGDLQNDPADFEMMLDKLNEGYDIVSGWRKNRKDTFMKKFVSRGARQMRRILVEDGVHDSGCTLKAYRRECFDNVDLTGEMHRFIVATLRWQGFTVAEVVVNHRARKAGKTKYNWKRIIKGFVDMISVWFWRKYSNRPLHIFGGTGMVVLAVGFATFLASIFEKVAYNYDLSNSALLPISVFLSLTGVILFVSGILADISVKSYYRIKGIQPYNIKEVVRN